MNGVITDFRTDHDLSEFTEEQIEFIILKMKQTHDTLCMVIEEKELKVDVLCGGCGASHSVSMMDHNYESFEYECSSCGDTKFVEFSYSCN